jgi:outer membrane lipoprotein SlyB
MKRFLLAVVIAIAFGGCAEEQHLDQDVTQLQEQQDALSAEIKKIQVVSKDTVKGHPQYTKLGAVQGDCFNLPNSTSGQVVHGDGLRAAAYRKYGDQVDAVVGTTIYFVADDGSALAEPYTENGYFECAGTAVHFAGAAN